MKNIFLFLSILLGTSILGLSQTVSNISYKIIGNKAYISYDLDKEADISLYVETKENKGLNTSFINWEPYLEKAPALRAVKGDVGKKVSPGKNKEIIWSFSDEVVPFLQRSSNGITIYKPTSQKVSYDELLNSLDFKVVSNNSIIPEMVWIDGNNGYNGYWVGKYQITLDDFQQFINDTGYKTQAEKQGYAEIWNDSLNDWEKKKGVSWKCDDNGVERPKENYSIYPVVNVSWEDAMAYCKWLSNKTNQNFSLPDYALWVPICASIDISQLYTKGIEYIEDGLKNNIGGTVNEIGWFDFNSNKKIHPVGEKNPNRFHLYDLRGNTYEWVINPYDQAKDKILLGKEMEDYIVDGKVKNSLAVGGSAFEEYEDTNKSVRIFPKEVTGLNIGFRVFMMK